MYLRVYPDDDRDIGWNISEMNNMWYSSHVCICWFYYIDWIYVYCTDVEHVKKLSVLLCEYHHIFCQ
jgi:hypothetical protein